MTTIKSFSHKNNHAIAWGSSCSQLGSAVIVPFLPKITFTEFLMYVSSPLGIWFGTSILSINPFNSRRKCASKRKAREGNFVHSIAEEMRDRKMQGLQMIVQDLSKRMKQTEHI